jgi:hypothetical protein
VTVSGYVFSETLYTRDKTADKVFKDLWNWNLLRNSATGGMISNSTIVLPSESFRELPEDKDFLDVTLARDEDQI